MEFSFVIKHPRAEEIAWKHIAADALNRRHSVSLRFYYSFVRPLMPICVRQMLQRNRKVVANEKWYEPSTFVHSLAQCFKENGKGLPIVHPWPDGASFGFVLTHDVETADGLQHVPEIAKMEEDLGFRSSWNIVPYKYQVDMGLIEDLRSRGFEIGIQGFNHDGRLYSSESTFRRRVEGINAALRKYGAVGFRSPMVHRNLQWLQLLDLQYDASCFDIDPHQAMPGGVGSMWPFVAGRFVELPYTLPQDHTLFIALGQQDCRIWYQKLDYIVKHNGMALMLTHPDYVVSQRNLDLYRQFLVAVRQRGGYWHALPREVASWWRERERDALKIVDSDMDNSICKAAID